MFDLLRLLNSLFDLVINNLYRRYFEDDQWVSPPATELTENNNIRHPMTALLANSPSQIEANDRHESGFTREEEEALERRERERPPVTSYTPNRRHKDEELPDECCVFSGRLW
ncbi:hypothetical protein ACFORL_04950 [Legionella dresdenensis]|uniref:Uncharacterized protein n=1 Tax=Legionella dresdenensis TaxID=450200 RepID=A0ABV8CEN9_9GAMM